MINFKIALSFLNYPPEERMLYKNDFRSKNAARLLIASFFVALLSVFHIIIFSYDLQEDGSKQYLWKTSLITAHSLFLFIMLIIGTILYFVRIKKLTNPAIIDLLSHFSYIFVLLMGVVISAIDQYVTSSINPFLITCIAVPLVILIPPVYTIFYFLIDFLAFMIVLPLVQSDSMVMLSIETNGTTSFVIGLLISVVLWQYNTVRVRQARVIEIQQTELEKQNIELQRIAEELKKANESKDKFFSIVAHDLRSPFNAFLGFTEMLSQDNELVSDAKYQNIILAMRSSAVNYYRLLENLLDWTRIQRKLMEFRPMDLQLLPLLKECLEIVNETADQKEIRILIALKENPIIYADQNMITTVVRNLLYNALKFTPRGGHITIDAKEAGNDEIAILVADSGIGMTTEFIGNIFNPDANTNRSGTEGESSTGLGLLLCKDLVERNNGKIYIESEPGKGSVFTFTVKIKPDLKVKM